jgi:phage tail sheath protein FI
VVTLTARHPESPGAYLQRFDQPPRPLAALRSDIAGFIGIAQRGPVGIAVPVESFRQFQAVFGDFVGAGFLAYSIRAFFENGGARARVVRVASLDPSLGARAASCMIGVLGGGAGWTIAASSPGSWGNGISVSFSERLTGQSFGNPVQSTAMYTVVASTSGFAANALVRVRQPGRPVQVRVLAAIDAARSRLYWVDPDPARRGGRCVPLINVAPNLPLIAESLTYDVLVYSQGRLSSLIQGLSLVPEAQNYAAILLQPVDFTRAGHQPGALPLISVLAPALGPTDIPAPLVVQDDAILHLAGGRDGLAALTPDDFIGAPFGTTGIAPGTAPCQGLAALQLQNDVSMLAAPDILIRPVAPPVFTATPQALDPCPVCPPTVAPATPVIPVTQAELPPVFTDSAILAVQAAMLQQCEILGDRIALLDPPWDTAGTAAFGTDPVQGWRGNFESAFGALYFPWVAVPDPLRLAPTRLLPPSGHVAGIIAASDLACGVHKAPANVALAWAQDASVVVDMLAQGGLNMAGINVIRGDSGRPLRLMGARAVSSDPNFRFINVRRLLCLLRDALDLCTRWVVFEPNTPHTRARLSAVIGRFLNQLWKQGALAGATAGAAYRVVCNDSNNPPTAQALGQLIVDIAVAPSVPFEFVLLRLGRSTDSLDIKESGTLAAGIG